MKKAKKKTEKRTPAAIRHNPATSVAALVIVVLTGYVYGMQSKVPSLLHKDRKVTRGQLKVEVKTELSRLEREAEALQENATLSFEDLDRKDAFKAYLIKAGMIVTKSLLDPAASAKGLLGIGLPLVTGALVIDKKRRDKKFTELKEARS
jgi:hypothetical protein